MRMRGASPLRTTLSAAPRVLRAARTCAHSSRKAALLLSALVTSNTTARTHIPSPAEARTCQPACAALLPTASDRSCDSRCTCRSRRRLRRCRRSLPHRSASPCGLCPRARPVYTLKAAHARRVQLAQRAGVGGHRAQQRRTREVSAAGRCPAPPGRHMPHAPDAHGHGAASLTVHVTPLAADRPWRAHRLASASVSRRPRHTSLAHASAGRCPSCRRLRA
jgi:hypothetical protein